MTYQSKGELLAEIQTLKLEVSTQQALVERYRQNAKESDDALSTFAGHVADALGIRETYERNAPEFAYGFARMVKRFQTGLLRADFECLAKKSARDDRAKALRKAIQNAASK